MGIGMIQHAMTSDMLKKKAEAFKRILCPVDGNLVGQHGLHADTPQAITKYGQRIFFCSTGCLGTFKDNAQKFFSTSGDPLWALAPNLNGLTVHCPECKTGKLLITGNEPRVLLKHGQCLWFCSYSCVGSFLKSPTSSLTPGSFSITMLGEHRASGLQGLCPITGKKCNTDRGNHYVEFHNGQRIYTCGGSCPAQIARNLRGIFRDVVNDTFIHPPQPSVGGLLQMCVHCPHVFVVDEEHTPRVQLKGGQNLYFHTNCCVDEFMQNPNAYVCNFIDENRVIREVGTSCLKKGYGEPSLSSSSSSTTSHAPTYSSSAPTYSSTTIHAPLYSSSSSSLSSTSSQFPSHGVSLPYT